MTFQCFIYENNYTTIPHCFYTIDTHIILSLLCCSNELKSPHFNKPFLPSTQHIYILYFHALCGLISYAGSSGRGQRGPHCRVARWSPQGQALCSRTPGSLLTCFSSYEQLWPPYVKLQESRCCFFICEIMFLESTRHFDGQSRLSQSVKSKGQRGGSRLTLQHLIITEDMLSLQSGGMAFSHVLTLV